MLNNAPEAGKMDSPQHPEDECQKCGICNPVWFAPNEVWNAINRTGILCPLCFIAEAEKAGLHPTAWELRPESPHPAVVSRERRLREAIATLAELTESVSSYSYERQQRGAEMIELEIIRDMVHGIYLSVVHSYSDGSGTNCASCGKIATKEQAAHFSTCPLQALIEMLRIESRPIVRASKEETK